ncbi:MAG: NifB/NifX family molybdenum-iron cluster-binding protein [Candidatus Kryptoniota bacterium]
MNSDSTKTIAVVTDDGSTISQHFGRARYYEVVTVQNGVITKRERREKAGHHTFAGHDHDSHAQHGFDAASQNKHAQMTDTIKDCQMVLTRGMGTGAYQSMLDYHIQPLVTEISTIDEAIQAIIDGSIIDHPENLH